MYIPNINRVTCWKLRPEHSVISSELFAIRQALQYIDKETSDNAIIFTDSKSSLQLIERTPLTYSKIVNEIQTLLLYLNKTRIVLLHWVRGHSGVIGNEVADKGANKGHQNDRSCLYDLTETELISKLKCAFLQYWDNYWINATDTTSAGLFLRSVEDSVKRPQSIIQFRSRRVEVVLHRLRMGHVGVAQYLHRFNMEESEICIHPGCSVPETVEHFLLHCPAYQAPRTGLQHKLLGLGITTLSLKLVLGGETQQKQHNRIILGATIQYIRDTGRLSTL